MTHKQIALKVDVDTYRGTLIGIPAITEMLAKYQAQATFFLSLGRDYSGCEPRPSSLKRYYDIPTRLAGRYMPPPDIGKRGVHALRALQATPHETALHAWNRFRWEERALNAKNGWIEGELTQATQRYEEVFSEKPKAFAAAGWKTNRHALRLTQRLGFDYASDCRGNAPFIPVIEGEIVACPQIPTTLPTLDELFALEPELTPEAAADRLLQLADAIEGDHVFTLRAELEGMRFKAAFERMLAGWQSRGYGLIALGSVREALDLAKLPRHEILFAAVSGRPSLRCVQGPEFLADHQASADEQSKQ